MLSNDVIGIILQYSLSNDIIVLNLFLISKHVKYYFNHELNLYLEQIFSFNRTLYKYKSSIKSKKSLIDTLKDDIVKLKDDIINLKKNRLVKNIK